MKAKVKDRLLCLLDDTLSPSDPIHMAGSRNTQPDLEKLVAESVAKSLPTVLQGVLPWLSFPGQNELKGNVNMVMKFTDATTVPTTLRGSHFFSTEQVTVVSQDLLSSTNKAFSRSLSRGKWKELTQSPFW